MILEDRLHSRLDTDIYEIHLINILLSNDNSSRTNEIMTSSLLPGHGWNVQLLRVARMFLGSMALRVGLSHFINKHCICLIMAAYVPRHQSTWTVQCCCKWAEIMYLALHIYPRGDFYYSYQKLNKIYKANYSFIWVITLCWYNPIQ